PGSFRSLGLSAKPCVRSTRPGPETVDRSRGFEITFRRERELFEISCREKRWVGFGATLYWSQTWRGISHTQRRTMKANANFRNQGWTKLNKSLATPANLLLLWLCLASAQAAAQTYSVLHTFTDSSGGTYPSGGLVLSGPTLYGVTHYGGISN